MENPIKDTTQPPIQKTPDNGNNGSPPNSPSPNPSGDAKNELERERAIAATAQKNYEAVKKQLRSEKIARKNLEMRLANLESGNNGEGGEGGNPNPSPSNTTNYANADEAERIKAKSDILSMIAFEPKYQAILSKDPTLSEIIKTNPLALIGEFIDAEEAVEFIKEKLDNRIVSEELNTNPNPTPNPKGGEGEPTNVSGSGNPDPTNPAFKVGGGVSRGADITPPQSDRQVEIKGNITPNDAMGMSNEQWEKLDPDVKRSMLMGDF